MYNRGMFIVYPGRDAASVWHKRSLGKTYNVVDMHRVRLVFSHGATSKQIVSCPILDDHFRWHISNVTGLLPDT